MTHALPRRSLELPLFVSLLMNYNQLLLRDSLLIFSVPLSTVGPPNVTYHNSTNEMVIGQQNVYYFTVEVAYASFLVFGGIRPGISAIGIHAYDSQTLLDSIPENPFCDALVSVNTA